MSLLLGHCGSTGIGGVIFIISVGHLIWLGGSIGLIGSFYTSSKNYTALAAPLIFDPFAPMAWTTAGIVVLVGFLVLSTPNTNRRKSLCNIWVGILLIHLIAVATYGIHFVLKLRDFYLIHLESFKAVSEKINEKVGFNEKMKSKTSEGGIIFDFVEQASAGMIIKTLPYPMNIIFFAGTLPEVGSFFLIVLPVVLTMFSLPFAIAIRNYFNSKKTGVVNQRAIYDGVPLTKHIFVAVPENKEMKADFYGFVEEDLASTFDGSASEDSDYSDYDSGYSDEESLVSSSRVTSEDGY